MTSIFWRLLSCVGGAVFGALISLILLTVFPLGLAFYPKLLIGAVCGACLGLLFPRVTGYLIDFLGALLG